MGKKSKTPKTKDKQLDCGINKKTFQNMLSTLLQRCVYDLGGNCSEKELLEHHLEIRTKLTSITKGQKKSLIATFGPRKDGLQAFLSWLKEKGVEFGRCDVCTVPDMDDEFGVLATEDISESAVFAKVPKSAMIHNEMMQKSAAGILVAQDPLLAGMPNIALAVFLIFELYSGDSPWKPYIDILPRAFNNVLYFSNEEFDLLRGSPSLREACSLWKSIVRQYSYLHLLFLKHSDPSISKLAEIFAFEDYRWAVSVIMTRENVIPASSASIGTNIALIPLLDLCNHSNTKPSVDFDDNQEACVCYAPSDVNAGEEIRIFYGPRPNVDLVLHNGFFFNDNKFDVYRLRLGLSKNDPLQAIRRDVLAKLQLPETLEHVVHSLPKLPIDDSLALYSQVFCAQKEELDKLLVMEDDELRAALVQENGLFMEESRVSARNFLRNRLSLLLRAYRDTFEKDDELLNSGYLNQRARAVVKLRRKEKLILKDAIQFLESEVHHNGNA